MATTRVIIRGLDDAWADVVDWLLSRREAGQDLFPRAHLKAVHEAAEFAADPSPEEWADVFMCLVAAAHQHGWALSEVVEAVHTKVAVNRKRTWAVNGDGTWSHV